MRHSHLAPAAADHRTRGYASGSVVRDDMSQQDRALKFGISLLRVNPRLWGTVAQEAEFLGFESVWMSDHLVVPAELNEAEHSHQEKNLISPSTPVFDVMVYLAALAASTSTLRIGTYVYQLALRHPFVAARAITTLDIVSDGRLELGIGAGYISQEWVAAGLDFRRRGRLLDESLDICRRLWGDAVVEHDGAHYQFPPVAFEPKPVQKPHPPIHVGGESDAAIRRALAQGDGWIGRHHSPETAGPVLSRVTSAQAVAQRDRRLEITFASIEGPAVNVDAWRALDVDRLIVAPWTRSGEAVAGMRAFAKAHLPS
jgi:probable F420-dependent oxidoreductase